MPNPRRLSIHRIVGLLAFALILVFSGIDCGRGQDTNLLERRLQQHQRQLRRARTDGERMRLQAEFHLDLEEMLSAIRQSPDREESRLTGAKIHMLLRRYDTALAWLEPLIDGDSPLRARARLTSVSALIHLGRMREAAALFRRTGVPPGDEIAYHELMLRLSETVGDPALRHRLGEAFMRATRTRPKLRPLVPRGLRNLADIAKEEGRISTAIAMLRRGIEQARRRGDRDILQAYLQPLLRLGQTAPPLRPVDWVFPPEGMEPSNGKGLVLQFWSTGCPSCRRLIPRIKALRLPLSRRGIGLVTCIQISDRYGDDLTPIHRIGRDGSLTRSRRFVERMGIDYPLARVDHQTLTRFGVQGYPTVFFIDEDGIIRDFAVSDLHFDRFVDRVSGSGEDATPKSAASGSRDSDPIP